MSSIGARAGVSFSLTSGRPHWLWVFWSFLTVYPSEFGGYRAWGSLGILGIFDNLNCSSFSLRWKSVAFASCKVKWNHFGYTANVGILQGCDPRLTNSPTWELHRQPAPLCSASVRPSGTQLQANKPRKQWHLKEAEQRHQQGQKVRVKEVFWNKSLVPRKEGKNEIVQDLACCMITLVEGGANRDWNWKGLSYYPYALVHKQNWCPCWLQRNNR